MQYLRILHEGRHFRTASTRYFYLIRKYYRVLQTCLHRLHYYCFKIICTHCRTHTSTHVFGEQCCDRMLHWKHHQVGRNRCKSRPIEHERLDLHIVRHSFVECRHTLTLFVRRYTHSFIAISCIFALRLLRAVLRLPLHVVRLLHAPHIACSYLLLLQPPLLSSNHTLTTPSPPPSPPPHLPPHLPPHPYRPPYRPLSPLSPLSTTTHNNSQVPYLQQPTCCTTIALVVVQQVRGLLL
uniref:Uncharacterized protein n=1 Tax=Vesanto virus TaxID=1955786 RepID=A0A7D4ZYC3_9VIRU|nr:hypothetical protein 1 [Vesanto virus]